MINPTRRSFLLGLLAAPVIVKASSLMAVKPVRADKLHPGVFLKGDFDTTALRYKATERYVYGWEWNLADHAMGPITVLPNTPALSPAVDHSQLSRVLQDYPQAMRLSDLLKRSETPDHS